jgi:hypothetical protein
MIIHLREATACLSNKLLELLWRLESKPEVYLRMSAMFETLCNISDFEFRYRKYPM